MSSKTIHYAPDLIYKTCGGGIDPFDDEYTSDLHKATCADCFEALAAPGGPGPIRPLGTPTGETDHE